MKIIPKFVKTMVILSKNGPVEVKISRSKAIRYRCLDCSGFSSNRVDDCVHESCPLYGYRLGTGAKDATQRKRDMVEYCTQCCSGSTSEKKDCQSKMCPMYPYRNSTLDKSVIIYTKINTSED